MLNITIGAIAVGYYNFLAQHNIGLLNILKLNGLTNIVVSLIVLDLITYLRHRAYHEVPLIWRLHRARHSDLDLDVSSASRFHPGEGVSSALFKISVGLALGPSTIAVAVHEAALLPAPQFNHTNVQIPKPSEGIVRAVPVNPDMHRIHHSDTIIQTDSNYSNLFSVWDRLFGTYTELENQNKISIGLR